MLPNSSGAVSPARIASRISFMPVLTDPALTDTAPTSCAWRTGPPCVAPARRGRRPTDVTGESHRRVLGSGAPVAVLTRVVTQQLGLHPQLADLLRRVRIEGEDLDLGQPGAAGAPDQVHRAVRRHGDPHVGRGDRRWSPEQPGRAVRSTDAQDHRLVALVLDLQEQSADPGSGPTGP